MIFPLVGNIRVKESILSAIENNKLPHAIVIEGDKGTGKHSLASFIALSAVCEGENKPCGECDGCRLAKGNNHPDISTTAAEEGKKNISVTKIRKLREDTFVKPHKSNKKVFIIDGADLMNDQSQNALLKVLEEPIGDIVFILIAETKTLLLETVVSRCQILSLSAPSKEISAEFINSMGKYPINDIREAVNSTEGNIGNALELLSGNSTNEVKKSAEEFFESFLKGDEFQMLSMAHKFEKSRPEAEKFLKEFKIFLGAYIKENYENRIICSKLALFYNKITQLQEGLVTNINLNLLFSSVVTEGAKIIKN